MDNNTDNHEKKEENTPIKDDSNEQIKETTTQEENNKQDVKQKHALHNHHQKHSEESKPKEDSEIDLKKIFNTDNIKKGFNKIKKSFSLKKKHQVHGDNYKNEKSNESISTIEFIIKHKTILLLLIPIILSIFLRIQPVYLPAADDWATNNVEGYYKNQIAQQISQQYPNLPETNKNLLIEGEYNKFLKENKDSMKAQIEANAQQMRTQFQDDSGQTYLLAIDPWFWYRLTENYLDHGYDYDLEVDGRYYNNHRLAPFLEEDLEVTGSTSKAQEFQVIVQSFLYKVWRVFDSDVSLLKIAFLTPLIIATLSIIPIFFLVRKIAGDLGGLVAGTILAINPFGLTRTVAGFADTDAFNFLFPIVIFGFLVLAIDHKKITQRIIYSALAGLSIGLYSFSWGGWMFMVSFSIFFLLGIIAFKLIKMIWNKKIKLNKFKEIGTVFVSFLIFSGISTLITGRFSYFINAPKGIIKFIQLKAVATKTIWPNVYTTVAELNPGNIGNIFSTIGGKLALLFTLLGIILSFYAYKKIKRDDAFLIGGSFLWFVFIIYLKDSFSSITKFILILGLPIIIKFLFVIFKEIKEDKENVEERYNIIFPLMFTIYLFGTMFSLSRGVRFSLLLIPAYAICFGAFAGIATKKLAELIKNTLNLNKTITYIILIIILGIIVLQPISAAKNVVGSQVPSMNDQWYEALIKIKEDSKEDAIINSWWDFGHWFKAIGDRGVTLDGGGQNQPQAHWLGKLMLAKDEKETLGVLRLILCGKNYPYNKIKELLEDDLKTKLLLDQIIIVEKEEAENILKDNNIVGEDAKYILDRTHCDPPEDYFITSQDMVSKAGVWGHFGSWDFTKASMYNKVKGKGKDEGIKILTEEFKLDEKTSKDYYSEIQTIDADQWISPWPGYTSNPMACNKISDDKFECPVPSQGQFIILNIDINKMEAFIPGNDNERYHMDSVYIPTEKGFKEIKIKQDQLSSGLSSTLIPTEDGNYNILTTHPLHAGSTFTKLFFAEGHGLKHFNKFYDVRDITGARIIVWKVDWEGEDFNNPFESFFVKTTDNNNNEEMSNSNDNNNEISSDDSNVEESDIEVTIEEEIIE